MGKVCVAGAGDVEIDYHKGTLKCKGVTLREGDPISINGSTGEVFQGKIATADSELKQVLVSKKMKPSDSKVFQYYNFIMKLADGYRKLGLRTNADQPDQVANAIAFGAEGIGLCRTEHMFFEGDRIIAVRQMILAQEESDRKKALAKLLPYQQKDFEGIFRALDGRPACIRLLDPPLHEFLPQSDNKKGQEEVAKQLRISVSEVEKLVHELHEFNPMLGFRGCRLGIVRPEISEMQARAIFQAAAAVLKDGVKVKPEIMVPLVGFKKELDLQVEIIHRVAAEVMKETGKKFPYSVGTMIEVPRGALTADEIAETAEFFSFGTNDLTQTCLGMSRDDSNSFLPAYQGLEIVKANPFASIDTTGVGQLMKIGVEKGRSKRPDLKIGICGEHGGDPSSVMFCHTAGLDYVSCSPFRVPIARLAAAQAALREQAAASKATAKKVPSKKKPAAKVAKTKSPADPLGQMPLSIRIRKDLPDRQVFFFRLLPQLTIDVHLVAGVLIRRQHPIPRNSPTSAPATTNQVKRGLTGTCLLLAATCLCASMSHSGADTSVPIQRSMASPISCTIPGWSAATLRLSPGSFERS
jgi:pyruvate,orthophosphate dikinase